MCAVPPSFQDVEANGQRAAHLRRRAAALGFALGIVDVPDREQHTFGEYGPQTLGRDGFADGITSLGSGLGPVPPQ